MTTTTSFNAITAATAVQEGEISWLSLRDEQGNEVNIFIPWHIAQAFADAFDMDQRSTEAVRRIQARQMEGEPIDAVRQRYLERAEQ